MYVYDQYDQQIVEERVKQFRDQIRRYLAGELTDAELLPLRLQNGLYIQRYAPMLRLAVPYGNLRSEQLRKLAQITRDYDKGYAHISTRQNIQLNWPELEDVPDILAELATVQMHSIQTSGNCIRNTTTDQFAGVAKDELIDPRPWCEIIRQWSTFHPEFVRLPRKFKIAVNGAVRDRAAIEVHDIGLEAVKNDAGELGFRVLVGLGRIDVPQFLGNLCRWLAQQAENLGVEIYPGFAAQEALIDEQGVVRGIITGDLGVNREGEPKEGMYTPGMELRAKYTLFAEGCRGHIGKQLISRYNLNANVDPQHYGIGIKELWDIDPSKHEQGLVVHTAGWPLDDENSGGSFLYHLENNQVVVGLIVDLSYSNPYLSPFDEFQRYKHHPVIKQYLEGGKRVSYGARAIAKGGLNCLPKMIFNGGALIGCDAGTLNFAKIKGSHTAMKSGMIAAEAVADALFAGREGGDELTAYEEAFKKSWVYEEMYASRNFGAAIHKWGAVKGGAFNFIDQNIFGGKLPFTLHDRKPDYACLKKAADAKKIDYPKPDGVLSFDKLSSVFLSNTNHEEDQPVHLKLKDPSIPIDQNLPLYDEPAQRYCPAGVYEVVNQDDGSKRFQINAQNCVHCKTCDIKDPAQNITWVAPEGTGGPNYPNM